MSDPAKGYVQLLNQEERAQFSVPSDEWSKARWTEVALAVRDRDREAVLDALRRVWHGADEAAITAAADDFLAGRRK